MLVRPRNILFTYKCNALLSVLPLKLEISDGIGVSRAQYIYKPHEKSVFDHRRDLTEIMIQIQPARSSMSRCRSFDSYLNDDDNGEGLNRR